MLHDKETKFTQYTNPSCHVHSHSQTHTQYKSARKRHKNHQFSLFLHLLLLHILDHGSIRLLLGIYKSHNTGLR
jgi:hypothetical protein